MMLYFITTIIILLIILFLRKKDPEPIFGIYNQPGKWYYLKYVLFASIYYFRKYSFNNKAADDTVRAGQGVKAIVDPAAMDKAQPLSNHAKAFDAVFFIAAEENKEAGVDKGIYVIAGCERRPLGICNGLFYLGLPGRGLLCSKKIPDTVLFGAPAMEFGAEGLKITPLKPMEKWAISYEGQMFNKDTAERTEVQFYGVFNATSKHFDYDCDLHPPAVIGSIAREKWSLEYFKALKTAHQSHYEQFGTLTCEVKIGYSYSQSYNFTLPSFRDHSFGNARDWSLMHRYAFHHIFLPGGTNISVGVICQPSTATRFEVGVVNRPNGQMLPVKWVDLELFEHGEGGKAPRDYAFKMAAGDKEYIIQVWVEYESVHFVSQDWEARMVERFCKFGVNGVIGRGVSEFHYRHRSGRPDCVSKDDPMWFKMLCAR